MDIAQLQHIVQTTVATEINRILPMINQSIYLDKITKRQTAKILGYTTIRALKTLAVNGKLMNDGQYYTIQPDANGQYDYNEVVAFRKLIDKKAIT